MRGGRGRGVEEWRVEDRESGGEGEWRRGRGGGEGGEARAREGEGRENMLVLATPGQRAQQHSFLSPHKSFDLPSKEFLMQIPDAKQNPYII